MPAAEPTALLKSLWGFKAASIAIDNDVNVNNGSSCFTNLTTRIGRSRVQEVTPCLQNCTPQQPTFESGVTLILSVRPTLIASWLCGVGAVLPE